MQRAAIVGGVLGLGTALVFGAAAVTATLFPNGPLVNSGPSFMDKGFGVGGGPAIMPAPAPPIAVDDGTKGVAVPVEAPTTAPSDAP